LSEKAVWKGILYKNSANGSVYHFAGGSFVY